MRARRALVRVCACLLAASTAASASGRAKLEIEGEVNASGIFDPSVEYDARGAVGWLAYSSVDGALTPFGPHVETRLARSLDAGATWSFVQVVNPSVAATLALPDGSSLAGVWNTEVASLVHDPDDPGREWKLFAHRIFRRTEDDFREEQNLPAYSWIVFRTAPDPAGTWSEEVALLGAGPLPPPPYDRVRVAVNELHPSLAGVAVYSEPGAFYREGTLYLSLTGLSGAGSERRIVLLASHDRGASWRYVATPLSDADAAGLGYRWMDGSAIAEDAGRVFLLATPGRPSRKHDGTLVFEFQDLATGALVRGPSGVPAVRKHVPLDPGFVSAHGGGQSDYHARNAVGGLLLPQIRLPGFPELFQIFATGERLADPVAVPALGGEARTVMAVALFALACRASAARAGRRRFRRLRGAG